MLVSQCMQYIGDGWLSQLLLKIVGIKINMKDTFRIASLNVFAAHLLPIGEAGGLAAAYHFYRKLGVNPENFIFLTVCWSIVTNVILFVMIIAPIFFLPEIPLNFNTRSIIKTAIIIFFVVTTIYLTRKILYQKLKDIFGKHGWFKHLTSFYNDRSKYVDLVKKHPVIISESMMAGLIYYGSNVLTLAFAFLVFGYLPNFALVTFAYAASLLFGRVTLAPGGIGAAEATLILIFLGSGVEANLTVAAVLIYRIISFWLPIPAGFLSFYSLRKKAGAIALEDTI